MRSGAVQFNTEETKAKKGGLVQAHVRAALASKPSLPFPLGTEAEHRTCPVRIEPVMRNVIANANALEAHTPLALFVRTDRPDQRRCLAYGRDTAPARTIFTSPPRPGSVLSRTVTTPEPAAW